MAYSILLIPLNNIQGRRKPMKSGAIIAGKVIVFLGVSAIENWGVPGRPSCPSSSGSDNIAHEQLMKTLTKICTLCRKFEVNTSYKWNHP